MTPGRAPRHISRSILAILGLSLSLLCAAPSARAVQSSAGAPAPDGASDPGFAGHAASPEKHWVATERDSRARIEAAAWLRDSTDGERIRGNQSSYDVRSYVLDLTLDPGQALLEGSVRMRASVSSGPLLQIDVDLSTILTVQSITSAGHTVSFVHQNDLLTISLDRPYQTDETVDLVISYGGNPAPGGAWHWDTKDGQPMVWTVGEPYGAHTWWPCKDLAADKADSVQVRVTAPSGMITASNGVLLSSSDDGVQATCLWSERHPIATYLVSVASHPYVTETDWYHPAVGDSMAIRFYIFPSDIDSAHVENPKVKTMISIYAGLFGEYPFLDEKYGEAECFFSGGMEHQTCTSVGLFSEGLSAHELAHQWWGDGITCRDFHHIWLNEGFASYCGALYLEALGGTEAYFAFWEDRGYYGPGTVYVPDDTDVGRIFDHNLSYRKASWVLHMLRFVLGDEDFFASLRAYFQTYNGSVATTEDFQGVCESVSGKDLDRFFQQWIHGEYYPVYSYDWTSTPSGDGYDVLLTLRQTQAWQIFEMPLEITIHTADERRIVTIVDSLAVQDVALHLAQPPDRVGIDERGWLLKRVEPPVMAPPFDRGVLLVNGLAWSLGAEVRSAYEDRAFWGDYQVDFWDLFDAPEEGYPATLPAPIGRGAIPPDTLGHYREVIWVGNNVSGDLDAWLDTSIESYLRAGGDLLLMTKQGDLFLETALADYAGIQWATGATLYDCIAAGPGFTDIARIGNQTLCKVFDLDLTRPDSHLLYEAHQNFDPERGIGVWRRPIGGGTWRPDGGQFVFLSGRPYRWDHADLRENVTRILGDCFGEPVSPAEVGEGVARDLTPSLDVPRPNPGWSGEVAVEFAIPRAGRTRISVVDVTGRVVLVPLDATLTAGNHRLILPIRGHGPSGLSSGVYFIRLDAPDGQVARKLTVTR